MIDNNILYGYLAAIGAIIFYGSYAVPIKLKCVRNTDIHPVIIQLYYSIALFLSSLLLLSYVKYPTDAATIIAGIISSLLWYPANTVSFIAIKRIGLATSIAIWAGMTVIITFIVGVTAFPRSSPLNNIYLAAIGAVVLAVGIIGISLSLKKSDNNLILDEEDKGKKGIMFGVICAVCSGLFGSFLLVPLQFIDSQRSSSDDNGSGNGSIAFSLSFSTSSMVITPIFALVYFAIKRKIPNFYLKETFIPLFISGLMWSIGTYCSIYAVLFLGLAIGVPLTQVALVVSGIWGICVFREIKNLCRLTLWIVSLVIILIGAVMLSLSRKL